ncbi:hypothetical protein BSKO_00766 [Bryopsis sp. KO-2023]|nr:hypothetical protein BSKO_00766 [Bryopsis sp. KO-2023]
MGFDIAILELDKTCEKKSIKLRNEDEKPEKNSRALGWGLDENGELPEVLQELDMDLIPSKKCKAAKNFEGTVFDRIVCAEMPGADVCSGDSGGPLVNPGTGCGENDVLVGLTSFGLKCSKNKGLQSPGAFTDVARYISWIETDGAKERVVYENPDCEIQPLPEDPTEKIPLPAPIEEPKILKPVECTKAGICIKLSNRCSDKTLLALVRYKMAKGWKTGGWWVLKPGQTMPVVADAMAGPAYFYAESEEGRYHWGKDNPFEFDGKDFNSTKATINPKYSSFTWHFNCNAATRKGCGFDRYCVQLRNECNVGIRALIRTKEAGKWAVRGWFFVKPGETVSAAKNVEDQVLFIHGISTTGRRIWQGPRSFKFDGDDRGFTKNRFLSRSAAFRVCANSLMVVFANSVLWALLVGALWGCTNPLVRSGSQIAERKKLNSNRRGRLNDIVVLATTPAFFVPQAVNLCGSVLFASLLASLDLTVLVPVANASSLTFNALVDVALGNSYRVKYLIPGLCLVVLGITLCSVKV